MNKKITTRFAPSPTGYLHIGGLRTALYNYLFALQNKGRFILRIEDTDQTRQVKGATESLIQILQKMGLKWQEGVLLDKSHNLKEKGKNKPYLQAKRLKIYREYCQTLIDTKKAYYCFCSSERLDLLRKSQEENHLPTKYDGLCRKLTESEIIQRLKNKEQYVVRLKIPENREVSFTDVIRGRISFQSSEIDDQVLMKSDGFPTYHLASVVDDHLMGITHVIRGEEWLPSTPKHILLYEAFEWQLPIFAHLPLLLNPDKSKLSKRQGDVAVEDFLKKGFLREAIINYVALLGWHPQDNREIFTFKELVEAFDLNKVQKAGAIFDQEKLKWFNSNYLQKLSVEKILKLSKDFISNLDKKSVKKVLNSQKSRLNTLTDIPELVNSFIKFFDYKKELLVYKKSDIQKTRQGLYLTYTLLGELKKWDRGVIKEKLERLAAENSLTNGDVFWPLRVALSGQEKSAPPEEIMEIIGQAESLNRVKNALQKLA